MKIKTIGAYIGSISGLLLLILAAVFLPQLFFSVQDSYQTAEIDVMNRDVFDILAVQTNYPVDTYTRLSKLSEMGLGDVTISVVEKSIAIEEFYDIKDSIRNREYMTCLVELLPNTFGDSLELLSADNINICNRYIVYGEDYTEGVLLTFWYMKIYLPSVNSYMELVIDSETYTIYYVSVEAEADIGYQVNYGVETESAQAKYYSEIVQVEEVYMEERAGLTAEIYQASEMLPLYLMNYYYSYYGVYKPVHDVAYTMVAGDDAVTIACSLPYNQDTVNFSNVSNKSLFFRAYVEAGYGAGPDISIGIPIIRQFVIE